MKKQAAATRTDDRLDLLFHALADRTRRGIVTRLVTGPASVSELAMPFAMTLPAVSKHIRVLEEAKIVTRKAAGGVRTCALTGSPFKDAAEWIDAHRLLWGDALESLARYTEDSEAKDDRK
jgi:DNA-binding transcriptional ArsR family regulator